jgi:hypothetical protein
MGVLVPVYEGWVSGKLKTDQAAIDFRLPDLADGREVRLASLYARKPVVLIFGSFSCNVFLGEVPDVEQFYRNHKDQAEFLFVYIEEAGHQIPELEPILATVPKGPDNRRQRVQKVRDSLGLTLPTVLDTANQLAQYAYDAYPRRMVVVDRGGRLALDLGRGLTGSPWDLAQVDEWLRKAS